MQADVKPGYRSPTRFGRDGHTRRRTRSWSSSSPAQGTFSVSERILLRDGRVLEPGVQYSATKREGWAVLDELRALPNVLVLDGDDKAPAPPSLASPAAPPAMKVTRRGPSVSTNEPRPRPDLSAPRPAPVLVRLPRGCMHVLAHCDFWQVRFETPGDAKEGRCVVDGKVDRGCHCNYWSGEGRDGGGGSSHHSGSLLQRMKHEELDRQLRKDRLLRDAL